MSDQLNVNCVYIVLWTWMYIMVNSPARNSRWIRGGCWHLHPSKAALACWNCSCSAILEWRPKCNRRKMMGRCCKLPKFRTTLHKIWNPVHTPHSWTKRCRSISPHSLFVADYCKSALSPAACKCILPARPASACMRTCTCKMNTCLHAYHIDSSSTALTHCGGHQNGETEQYSKLHGR